MQRINQFRNGPFRRLFGIPSKQRLGEMGLAIPDGLKFVPVDFEAGDSWWEKLVAAGFDTARPAMVASTGVSMYLTREAVAATLRQIATLASGSTLAMTFLLPLELIDVRERAQHQAVYERARAAGTPFLSFFAPDEILKLALEAGFRQAPSSGESILVAGT